MIHKSAFFWRVFLTYTVVALASIVLLTLLVLGALRDRLENETDTRLREQAALFAVTVRQAVLAGSADAADPSAVEQVVAEFAGIASMRYTVIDDNGVVLADSHESPVQMNNHLRRPEVSNAISMASENIDGGSSSITTRLSQTLGAEFNYLALPVYAEGELAVVARAAFFSARLEAAWEDLRAVVLRLAGVTAALGVLLALGVALWQTRQVNKLSELAAVIAQGDFGKRVPVDNPLGLRELARAINQLARNSAAGFSDITADRNRLATIFTGMVEGVIDVDQNQKIIHMNEAAARLLNVDSGYSGRPAWEAIRHHEITQALEQTIRTDSVIKNQLRLPRGDRQDAGDYIVDVYAASLSDDSGNSIGAVAVLHDITDLKSLERIRTDFVANASHELKTPITAIRGLAESMMDDRDVNRETLLNFIDRIHVQSLRLSQLVGDLLTLSRLESARIDSDFTLVDMLDVTTRAVGAAEATVEEKRQSLHLNLPADPVKVYGDRQNLSQLLDNLIDNAVKYTPEGGTITVSLSADSQDMLLKVADSGIGISPQYQKRIFERFYRVDKARSRSLGGTGLGLSIVKNIAEKHNGQVTVESQPGRGSVFSFTMALAQTTKPPASPSPD